MFRIQRFRSVGTRNRSVGIAGFVPFVPTAPANAAMAVAVHPSLCRSDASNTVPCVKGGSVQWWYDLISKTWFQQTSAGLRYVMQQDAGSGKYYVVATSTAAHQFGWVVNANPNGSTFTIGFAVGNLGTSNFGAVVDCSDGTTNGMVYGCGASLGASSRYWCYILNAGASSSTNTSIQIATGRVVTETTTGAANVTLNQYFNGLNWNSTTVGSVPLANAVPTWLGGNPAAASAFNYNTLASGRIYGIVGYNSVSAGTRSEADTWLKSLLP